MEPVLSTLVTALVAGAAAKATKDVASKAVLDAYAGLKAILLRKLGSADAVRSVEDDPASEPARVALVEALAKQDVEGDRQLKALADRIVQSLTEGRAKTGAGPGDIDIDTIRGGINVIVEDLVAAGRISLGPVIAETGDARVVGLSAGTDITATDGLRATDDSGAPRKN